MADPSSGWTERSLTAGERAELRALAARMVRFPPRLAVVTALMLAIIATRARGGVGLLVVVALVLLAVSWSRWLRARSLAGKLVADADHGWVALDGEGREVLPASRAHWTEGGAPAPWRSRTTRRR